MNERDWITLYIDRAERAFDEARYDEALQIAKERDWFWPLCDDWSLLMDECWDRVFFFAILGTAVFVSLILQVWLGALLSCTGLYLLLYPHRLMGRLERIKTALKNYEANPHYFPKQNPASG